MSALVRYLHFLLSALNELPKEAEDNFYRGVGPDAVKVGRRPVTHRSIMILCIVLSDL